MAEIEEMIQVLKANPKMIIDKYEDRIVLKPGPNKKCACGSRLAYKNCKCNAEDKKRTQDFIEGQ